MKLSFNFFNSTLSARLYLASPLTITISHFFGQDNRTRGNVKSQ